MAIDLSTDSVVADFLRDLVKSGGMPKDGEEFILQKNGIACA